MNGRGVGGERLSLEKDRRCTCSVIHTVNYLHFVCVEKLAFYVLPLSVFNATRQIWKHLEPNERRFLLMYSY